MDDELKGPLHVINLFESKLDSGIIPGKAELIEFFGSKEKLARKRLDIHQDFLVENADDDIFDEKFNIVENELINEILCYQALQCIYNVNGCVNYCENMASNLTFETNRSEKSNNRELSWKKLAKAVKDSKHALNGHSEPVFDYLKFSDNPLVNNRTRLEKRFQDQDSTVTDQTFAEYCECCSRIAELEALRLVAQEGHRADAFEVQLLHTQCEQLLALSQCSKESRLIFIKNKIASRSITASLHAKQIQQESNKFLVLCVDLGVVDRMKLDLNLDSFGHLARYVSVFKELKRLEFVAGVLESSH